MNTPRLRRTAGARCVCALACLTLGGASIQAWATDVVPFVGVRFGGELANQVTPYDPSAPSSLSADSSIVYGGVIDVPVVSRWRALELYFGHQPTTVPNAANFQPPVRDVTIDVMQIGLADEYPTDDPRLSWLLIGMVGATRIATTTNSDLRPSIGLGGGGRWMVSPHFGFRGDLRAIVTFAGNGQSLILCSGGCVAHYTGTIVLQGELSVGVIFRF